MGQMMSPRFLKVYARYRGVIQHDPAFYQLTNGTVLTLYTL